MAVHALHLLSVARVRVRVSVSAEPPAATSASKPKAHQDLKRGSSCMRAQARARAARRCWSESKATVQIPDLLHCKATTVLPAALRRYQPSSIRRARPRAEWRRWWQPRAWRRYRTQRRWRPSWTACWPPAPSSSSCTAAARPSCRATLSGAMRNPTWRTFILAVLCLLLHSYVVACAEPWRQAQLQFNCVGGGAL